MLCYPVGLYIESMFFAFTHIYINTLQIQAGNAQVRLGICAVLPEPSLLTLAKLNPQQILMSQLFLFLSPGP